MLRQKSAQTENRFALIIANDQYDDEALQQLISPQGDAHSLSKVLSNPECKFNVQILVNKKSHEVNQAIETFYNDRTRDDLLLLYFSGHGIKDVDGKLYLATSDTERKRLLTTSISAFFINDLMRRCRSRRQVLFLDCCFGGAFVKGMITKSDSAVGTSIGTRDYFQGSGRVIITATDSMQYAFEEDKILERANFTRSIFTSAIIDGIETWRADYDKDGRISITELYEYIDSYVRERTPNQRPSMWSFETQGEIIIAERESIPEPERITETEFTPETEIPELEPIPEIREEEVQEVHARASAAPQLISDLPTTEDELNFDVYAEALYQFIINEKTNPPFTISIQAPWGGGKSSLMQMIREKLDPEHPSIRDQDKEATELLEENYNLGNAYKLLKDYKNEKFKIKFPENKAHRITIWFTPWKYASTEQVWAGLAHSIIDGISERLSIADREWFWLTLNYKRLDLSKIRTKIHNFMSVRILQILWKWILGFFGFFMGILLSYKYFLPRIIPDTLKIQASGFISLAYFAWFWFKKYQPARKKVDEEDAKVILSDYIQIPNYSEKLGFIHHVVEDLKHVFDKVPERQSLVIFIDDLDRCSPIHISKVLEGVNLFLAGEFKKCIFVMGMDTEIVAAALDEAHKDILDNLPADAKASPIGWRYMDKFVQLPFFIPPTTSEQMVAYTDALLSERAVTNDPEVQEAATLLRDPSLTDIVGEATKISLEKDFNTSQSLQLTQIARSQEREKLGSTIRKQIQDFDEEEDIVKKEIRGAAGEIDNPRQMKRFINMFRLLSFHKIAQDTSKGIQLDANQPPTLNQIKRWIILSLKWPEVARWIRREGSCKEIGRSTRVKNLDLNQISTIKLLHLEEISKRYDKGEKIRTRKAWEKKIKDRLHLDLVQCPWIDNPELMKFFEDERDKEKMERLSAAAGKGLW